MPEFSNIHQDFFLSDLSIAYTNEGYIADEVALRLPVKFRSDKYFIYNPTTFLKSSGKNPDGTARSRRRPGSRSSEITWDVSNQSYACEQMAKSFPVYDEMVNYANVPLDIEVDTTMALSETLLLDNEIQVATAAMTRANFASANKAQLVTNTTSWAANAAPYATTQTSFPMSKDIPNAEKAVMLSLLRAPNSMALNYAGAVTLAANWEYKESFKYVSNEGQTRAGLAKVVRGLDVIEGRAQYVTSAEGAATTTTGYVWQDDQSEDAALIYYKAPSAAGLRTLSFMLTFEAPDDTTRALGMNVLVWREGWRNATVYEVRTTRDYRFPCTDGSTNGLYSNGYALGGYLISGLTL